MSKMTQAVYEDAKKLLGNGNSLMKVVELSGLSYSTVRMINKSKNFKSYVMLSNYNHITKAQRSLMKEGYTAKEAKAMLTAKKPTPGVHELYQEPIVKEEVQEEVQEEAKVEETAAYAPQTDYVLAPNEKIIVNIIDFVLRAGLVLIILTAVYFAYKMIF